jgi:lipoprotein-anchoring transpeptidase ErfK/SrfK
MKKLVILIIVVALAWLGWRWLNSNSSDSPFTEPGQESAAPGPGSSPKTELAPIAADAKAEFDKAEALWKEVEAAGGGPARSLKAAQLCQLYTAVLRKVYNTPGQGDFERQLVETRLKPLGNELFFSKTRYAEDPAGIMAMHAVQAGESPDKVAIKYGMSHELLNRLRGRDPNDSALNLGDSLKVVRAKDNGGYALRIDKSDFILDCYIAGLFARRYSISHGSENTPTPIGTTSVTDRVFQPTWTLPDTHEVVPYGDPRNILGPVWLAFGSDGLNQSGIGLHGYTGPDAKLGVMVSNGCIRMQNEQALELFHTLPHPNRAPTAVEIVE